MSGPDAPDAPPPEVPEEFAAAYREAYRRALEAGDEPADVSREVRAAVPQLPPQEVVAVGTRRTERAASRPSGALERWRAASWFAPAVLGVLALVLVVAAYATGKVVSGDGTAPRSSSAPGASDTSRATTSEGPASSSPSTSPGSWDGAVTPVSVDALSADCTAPPSQDAAGHKVTYVPGNAIDGKPDTAWRCPGTAIGQKLTLRLASEVDVAEVGLIPGYAKTDPSSGADRYAENNRITRVRWTFADGVSVVQRLDPDPHNRTVQLLRVPRTTTDRITLEILAVRGGPKDVTAISELSVATAG